MVDEFEPEYDAEIHRIRDCENDITVYGNLVSLAFWSALYASRSCAVGRLIMM